MGMQSGFKALEGGKNGRVEGSFNLHCVLHLWAKGLDLAIQAEQLGEPAINM